MKLRKIAGTAVFVIAAMGLASGTSYADPASEPAPNTIQYETKLADKTVVTTLTGGIFAVSSDGKKIQVQDGSGSTVVEFPASFNYAGKNYPMASDLSDDNKVLKLTPDAAKAVPSLLTPVASPIENQRAQETFATQFGIATAIGSFGGLAVGAIVGGVVGCVLGLPFFGVGCIPAAITGASIGGIIGTVAVGGPALLIAGIDLIQTLTAPPGTTKWNYVEPGVGTR
ncbi:ammonium transporter [Antrihabitans sp. NCIMB 15449]|uniref:Ammonium transporter n=1 Tax=Antrihabitans spumae TaxID=3373370 RepID=A0ABW7JHM1_9NOCA